MTFPLGPVTGIRMVYTRENWGSRIMPLETSKVVNKEGGKQKKSSSQTLWKGWTRVLSLDYSEECLGKQEEKTFTAQRNIKQCNGLLQTISKRVIF